MSDSYMTPSGKISFGPPRVFVRRMFMPYGWWETDTGREVLFNRFYEPIWQRHPGIGGGAPMPADPKEWVAGIVGQHWVYRDDAERLMRRAALAKLIEWGLPVDYPGALAKPFKQGAVPVLSSWHRRRGSRTTRAGM